MENEQQLREELERERTARLLAEQHGNAYRELVETVRDIIYRSDFRGHFIYVNPSAVQITGFSEEELIGMHFTELIREDVRQELSAFYHEQVRNGIQSTYREFPIVTKTGQELWIGQTVDIHRKENGDIEFIALCRDISDRKKAEEALIRSENHYRSIIENLELGMIEVNTEGVIVGASKHFCLLIGYSREELIGKNAIDLLLTEDGKKQIAREMEKRLNGQTSVYEIQLRRKDGSLIWVIIGGAPLYNEQGEVIGTAGIHIDISQRRKMEEDLRQALRSKDLFVANMSHEIRTPLNAIIGMARLLGDSSLDEQQKTYLSAIRTSSDNLMTIVNDLLDFSKLEAGKMELEIIPEDLRKAIDTTAQLWELKASEKGLAFERTIDKELAECYHFDPTRLYGVLGNLLHNAVKFTETGKIAFTVCIERSDDVHDRISFSVRDTGIGIPKDKMTDIFESFVQAESDTTRKYGGTGLGLSIARNLVGLMGGELTVNSDPGKGSEFRFELELERTIECRVEPEETPKTTDVSGLRVLLVEDNKINRYMAQTILEQWKTIVTTAENGREAVDHVRSTTFDLILMDVQMPVMDGLQAAMTIRTVLQQDIPIIALTANAVKGEADKCTAAGMNGFVSKPFKQEDLMLEIARVLGKRSVIGEAEGEAASPLEADQTHQSETLVHPLSYFKDMEDPRIERSRLHSMDSLLFIALSATIAGADNWVEVGDFAEIHEDWIREYVELPNGIPSHDTFNRFFSILDPLKFEECFRNWANSFNRGLGDVIAIDGKSIKGCKTGKTSALHMVSAWSTSAGISIGQVRTPEKKSELVAVTELLDTLYLKGSIVTLDALSCQPKITEQIIAAGADYMIQVKKNRMKLYEAIDSVFNHTSFADAFEDNSGNIDRQVSILPFSIIEDVYGEHSPYTGGFAGIESIVCVKRISGDDHETSYYITSLDLTAEQAAKIIRSHWSIENNLHCQLDVTFREDNGRDRDLNCAQNHSVLRKIALHTVESYKPDLGAARKRKLATRSNKVLAEMMGL